MEYDIIDGLGEIIEGWGGNIAPGGGGTGVISPDGGTLLIEGDRSL